jgi:25S rRNA (adenine2142-N1)-methyltransferase
MLALIHAHLKPESSSLLFLVLPLPCVTNSRYLSPSTLLDMMKCVGFELVEERWKEGGRVGYWLWAWREQLPAEEWARWRRKRIVTDGSRKNNFAILLTDPRWPTACDI